MNLSELARRMRVRPDELREKLPDLGFSIGKHAIKVDDRVASQIQQAWQDMKRRERLQEKVEDQKRQAELREKRRAEAKERPVALPAVLTIREFAGYLNLPIPRVMQELMHSGILANINDRIDFDTAAIVAEDLGFKAERKVEEKEAETETGISRLTEVLETDAKENLRERPPVIVVMGHVDHGKTKLLDAIRKTHVMESEAGGITQHIGAYQVKRNDRLLTFIDTPGHEAFTVMRSRGAKVADVAILVVAADDGVQPQTKEAIDIIKSANLPFIVALNKIDRAEANIDRVKGQLAELNVVPEDWSGNVVMAPISAKQGIGIQELLDVLLLVADMHKEQIVANPARPAIGTIIESHVDRGEGPVATALVQSGTLRVGDTLGVKDAMYGRVRAMRDWKGDSVKEAPPSMPVKIIGFKYAPAVGDIMEVPEDVTALKRLKVKPVAAAEELSAVRQAPTEEEASGEKKKLSLIIRADVLGSLEAILGMLDKVKHDAVAIDIVGKGLGNITDVDVMNAESTGAIVIGFNVRPIPSAEQAARDKNVVIRQYKVIYKLFEDVLEDLKALLPTEKVITELGTLEVLAVFKKIDKGWIAGGVVKTGTIESGVKLRIMRGGQIVGEGEITQIQVGKTKVRDVKPGQDFGFSYLGKTKVEVGDIIEAYKEEIKGRELDIEGIRAR